jgi:hypothetical protein
VFDLEVVNLKKLNWKLRKSYQTKISHRFAALGNLDDNVDINRAWEGNKENIKTSTTDSVCH